MDKIQPNRQDNESQGNSDLLPFEPDYQETEAQNLYQIFLSLMSVNFTTTTFYII